MVALPEGFLIVFQQNAGEAQVRAELETEAAALGIALSTAAAASR